jgi:exosome complex component RRP41
MACLIASTPLNFLEPNGETSPVRSRAIRTTHTQNRPPLLSASALRLDNRRPLEIRPIEFDIDTLPSKQVDGAASVTQGLTKVQVTVCGPRDVRLSRKVSNQAAASNSEKAVLNVYVTYAPFVSGDRTRRKGDRRTVEFAAALKNTFEPVISMHLYQRSSIDIAVLILQQDGAVMSAAINATTLALIHAGIALSSPVSSVTLSCLHDTPLLDPCAPEETDLPTVTVACLAPPHDQSESVGPITLVNMETRLSIDRFEAMLKLAAEACAVVSKEIDAVIRNWGEQTHDRMAGDALAASAPQHEAMDED